MSVVLFSELVSLTILYDRPIPTNREHTCNIPHPVSFHLVTFLMMLHESYELSRLIYWF